jgi:hypothetical protein
MAGTFTVKERVYSEPNEFGHRALRYKAGAHIPFEEALAAGLTDDKALDPDELPFQVHRDVYEDEPGLGRKMIVRKGSIVTIGRAKELGLVAESGEPLEEPRREQPKEPAKPEGDKVRTAKVPAPGA